MPSKRSELLSKLDSDAQKNIDAILNAYEQVFIDRNTATVKTYEQAKEEALKVFSDYPELEKLYKDYVEWRKENKRVSLPEDNKELVTGYLVATDLLGVDRQYKPDERIKESVLTSYQAWVDENEFVPNDEVLAHFSKISPAVFTEVRTELTDVGYDFEANGDGYKVIERPNPQVVRLLGLVGEDKKEEVAKLIAELLTAKA